MVQFPYKPWNTAFRDNFVMRAPRLRAPSEPQLSDC